MARALLLAVVLLGTQVAPPPEGAPSTPALRRLVDGDAGVERVATNFRAANGPLWLDGALIFTDPPRNQVLRLAPGEEPAVVIEDTGGARGLAADGSGRLLLAERDRRRLVRREDGENAVLLERAGGQPLLGPSALALAADGTIYLLDYQAGVAKPSRTGRLIRVAPSGTASVIADGMPLPSGVAVAPDGREVYVADAALRELRAYSVEAGGGLGPARRLASIVPWKRGVQGRPGGIAVDQAGHLYLAGPGGIWVLDRNGGRLGVIATPETPSAAAFGDADGKTLYITAETSIYKVRLSVAGAK